MCFSVHIFLCSKRELDSSKSEYQLSIELLYQKYSMHVKGRKAQMDSCDKIVIFGQTVQVPPNRVAYNAIRMDFIRMANEAAAQYEKLYKQDGSIQKVINGLGEQMHDCLAPTLDHCITTLIQHGVIDIDVQTFAERYQSFAEPCAEAFNDVYDRYAEVVMDEEELN